MTLAEKACASLRHDILRGAPVAGKLLRLAAATLARDADLALALLTRQYRGTAAAIAAAMSGVMSGAVTWGRVRVIVRGQDRPRARSGVLTHSLFRHAAVRSDV